MSARDTLEFRMHECRLTPRQKRMTRLAFAGKHAGVIAEMLGCCRATANRELGEVYAKAGVPDRAHLIAKWLDLE